ncbi:hypothetical protein GCM10027035_22880 [Emticicia sediminis]
MKKKLINLSNAILSREQMKRVKGGYGEGSGGGLAKCNYECCDGKPLVCEGFTCEGFSCNPIVESDAYCRYKETWDGDWKEKNGCPIVA